MIREILISTIKQMVEGLGYAFFTGSERAVTGVISEFPSVWLMPPKSVGIEGQTECRATYRLTIKMMTSPVGQQARQGESVWPALV